MSEPDLSALIRAAIAAAEHAYIPYSHYPVGAALLTENGAAYTGCNIENASYPATICAERTALVKAVSEGQRVFRHLVVVTRDGGSPCGVCRQTLFEFAPDLPITLVRMDGTITSDTVLSDLLPMGFGPHNVAPSP